LSTHWVPGRYGHTFIIHPLIGALTRCTVLDPTQHSRAVFNIPLPLASETRIASSIFRSTRARPIGFAALGAFLARSGNPRIDPLLNNRPFEFGKNPEHLK